MINRFRCLAAPSAPADLKSKTALLQWLRIMEPEGRKCAYRARAGDLPQPRCHFPSVGRRFTRWNRGIGREAEQREDPIHCIDLAGGLGGNQLQKIARLNGGRYASRAGNMQSSP